MIQTVNSFISMVEANQHLEAVELFYADDVIIKDNHLEQTRGKKKQIVMEQTMLATAQKMTSQCVRPFFVNDNWVVIKWHFRFEFKNNTFIEIEELAYQQWDNGKIKFEQFFFDPKQFVPKPLA